MRHTVQTKHF